MLWLGSMREGILLAFLSSLFFLACSSAAYKVPFCEMYCGYLYPGETRLKSQAKGSLRSALGGPEMLPSGNVIESTHSDGGTGPFWRRCSDTRVPPSPGLSAHVQPASEELHQLCLACASFRSPGT